MNKIFNKKLTPNPNVLIELGYAIHLLGWERIICVNNVKYGKNELLPFDLRSHRISTFEIKSDDKKEELILLLKNAIKSIVNDYENICNKHKNIEFKNQDKIIFNKILGLATEQLIKDTINTIANNLYYNSLHIENLKSLKNFHENSLNCFINKKVDERFVELICLIDEFISLCFKYIIVPNHSGELLSDIKDIEITEIIKHDFLQNERYFYPKEPFRNEEWSEYHKRYFIAQEEFSKITYEIEEAYKNFVSIYKIEILI